MNKYTLKIDMNILNHLGLNLYSNVPAVLSELIANAWDADATVVKIATSTEEIEIYDNGCGMNSEDLNEKYLNVGYQRRKRMDEDRSIIHNRKIMGRKGIGKLSVFSIAEHVEVYTKKESSIGISMKVSDIKEQIKKNEAYNPSELQINESNRIAYITGTKIVLKNLKKRILKSLDDNLRKRVARRFDIWSDKFKVYINDREITIEDRDYFHKLEFTTIYGNYPKENFLKSKEIQSNEGRLQSRSSELKVSGWIGLVKESGGLQDGADNLNKISILCRGKVALEDILDEYREGGLYTKFLIGEIRADFLDSTEHDDIATSSRQDLIKDDDRFIKLKNFIKDELKFIQSERVKYKQIEGVKVATKIPAIRKWLSTLNGDTKKSAEKLFSKINTIANDEKQRITLYQYGILAFEKLRRLDKLSELDDLEIENLAADNLEKAGKLFLDLDDIEAILYYEISDYRLKVIKKLINHISNNDLEKVIQQHIFNHLWLLDPSWDRATEHPEMEKSIKKILDEKLTDSERRSRFDIRYKKVSGKNIIIELKRASVRPSFDEIRTQIRKYRSAVRKELKEFGENENIEVICLIGSNFQEWEDESQKNEDIGTLREMNTQVLTYKTLIKNAENSYSEYLEQQKKINELQKIIQEILDEISNLSEN